MQFLYFVRIFKNYTALSGTRVRYQDAMSPSLFPMVRKIGYNKTTLSYLYGMANFP